MSNKSIHRDPVKSRRKKKMQKELRRWYLRNKPLELTDAQKRTEKNRRRRDRKRIVVRVRELNQREARA